MAFYIWIFARPQNGYWRFPSVRPTHGQKQQAELGETYFDPYNHFRRSSQYGLSDKGQQKGA
jgi:hypothetical protein